MKQTTPKPQHDQVRSAASLANQSQPQPHQNDPDILDAVIREQPLEIVLAQGEEHAEDGADGSQQQYDASPAQGRTGQ